MKMSTDAVLLGRIGPISDKCRALILDVGAGTGVIGLDAGSEVPGSPGTWS